MYTIWGTETCSWCTAAKEFLASKNEPYEFILIRSSNLMEFLELTNDAKTVPQIFDPLGGRIGGYEDLVEFYKTQRE